VVKAARAADAALPSRPKLRQILGMTRLGPCLFVVTLLASSSACKRSDGAAETTPPTHAHGHEHHGETMQHDKHGDFEGREVVDNWKAQTGDVTVCPMSGKKFEVTASSDRYEYQGYTFVFCCSHCVEKISADPGKYLDTLVEEAKAEATPEAPGEGS
jgi:YHS domain-containing protein